MAWKGWEDYVPHSNSLSLEPKRAKYGAVKTTVDGITFASKKEAARYQVLKLREQAGEIRTLRVQPVFELWTSAGRAYRQTPVAVYRADFSYDERQPDGSGDEWLSVTEDVKGVKTPIYRLKKKMVEAQYGLQIREI